MNKITNQNYKSIVYISHPSGGLQSNTDEIADIINKLIKQYPDYLFISPVHAFSFAYNSVDYETGIKCCLWLLDKCDEMWVYGDWKNSKGCNMEIEYCKEHLIPYLIANDVDDIDKMRNYDNYNKCFTSSGAWNIQFISNGITKC